MNKIVQHITVSTFWIDLNFSANTRTFVTRKKKFNLKIKLFKIYSNENVIFVEKHGWYRISRNFSESEI